MGPGDQLGQHSVHLETSPGSLKRLHKKKLDKVTQLGNPDAGKYGQADPWGLAA